MSTGPPRKIGNREPGVTTILTGKESSDRCVDAFSPSQLLLLPRTWEIDPLVTSFSSSMEYCEWQEISEKYDGLFLPEA